MDVSLSRFRECIAHLHPMQRLRALHKYDENCGFTERATTRRASRMVWLNEIKSCSEPRRISDYVYGNDEYDGPVVAVIVWSPDCDHVCGESRYTVEATAKALDAFCYRQLEGAEGPMTFSIQRPSEMFHRWSRDMIMEAHEDGHRHSVSDAYSPSDGPEGCEFGRDEYEWNLRSRGM